MIGRTLDRYRIDSKLGEGGMGVVYKGHDDRLGRPVAIKVLPPEQLADLTARERFIREAKAASALNHPGIVTIHDIRSDGESDFIVMEWIDGRTLAESIPATGMPIAEVLRAAIQIADALAAAHGAGILHRDLKPSNVMVTSEGRVKILDFGLAKLLQPDAGSEDVTAAGPLTEARVVLGTAAYMSPEQAEGQKLDARSDIFSFGAVLYEMATGKKAFSGSSSIAILGRIIHEDPKPPSEIAGSVPPDLERTILRCLRKDPGRRYQTMSDLRAALEDLRGESVAARVPPPSLRATWPWRSIAAALLLLAVAGYAGWRWRPAERVEPLHASVLTTLPGQELYPSLAPNGDYVAFTWTGPKQDNTDVYVQQIGGGPPLRLTSDARTDYNPVWSPDGRWIAFLRGDPATPFGRSDRELRLIPPLGGPERKVADVRVQEATANPVFLTWCPDSRCVIVTDSAGPGKPDALFVIALETGAKKQLTAPDPPGFGDTNPAVSPDGTSVLFLRRATWGYGALHVLRLRPDMTADGEPRHLAVSRVLPENAAWLPSGEEILIAPAGFTGGASLWRLSVVRPAEPERLPFVGEDGVMPTLSRPPSGGPARLVYVRSAIDENIWRVDTADAGAVAVSPPTIAIASTRSDIHPQLAPDGLRVAFTSTRTGAWHIWVSDLDGSNALQLTSLNTQTGTGAPYWSPDGQQIAFASDAEGQFDIFVIDSGGGQLRNLTSHPAVDHVPTYSRDGQWIYFSSTRSGQFQVWKAPASGGAAVQVTTDGGWLSRESRDGSHLYFTPTAAIGAPTQFWRIPTSGGPAVKVVDGVLNMTFEVLPRGIYYLDQLQDSRIQFFDFGSGRSATVARNLGDSDLIGGFAASADGRTLLYGKRDSSIDDLMLVDNIR